MKQNHNSAAENAISYEGVSNANLQLQATHREPTSFQNVGELLNAKRPLPVTPFSVQPAEGSMDIDHQSLPATPSITELVSLMEQLHIVPPVAPATNYVAGVSDSNSDDKENVLFPELQSLGEQFQIVPSANPASHCVFNVSDSESNDDSDAEYVLFPELQSLGEQVLQIIQLLQ